MPIYYALFENHLTSDPPFRTHRRRIPILRRRLA